MSDIPNITPNANMVDGSFDEPIRIGSINLTDIKIDKPINSTIDSMACTGVESIGDIQVNL